MNMEKNRIPSNVTHIHLIAICGTAMGALALMLKEMGYTVTGSDQRVYPPMSDFLRENGIHLREGFNPSNLTPQPDLVVVGNAVSQDNCEVQAMMDLGLPFCSMPQALNGFAAHNKKTVLITGTHGKTSTSSLMAYVLYVAQKDPSFMIGGILKDFNSNYRHGAGDFIVIEGDEYDTAFFDKGAKFFHYVPEIAILTSVEFDHADIFDDLAHVKRTFKAFLNQIPRDHLLLAYDSDENVMELADSLECRQVTYGQKPDAGWRLGKTWVAPPWHHFETFKNGHLFSTFKTKLMGRHNLMNALSVIAAAEALGIDTGLIKEALATFSGVRRRQDVRGVKNGITVMDDFAHHPTAVRETLKAVRPFYRQGRIIAVFEPRTNSSMRKVFQDIYPSCFDPSDLVLIRRPSMLEKIPLEERFSSERLVADLTQRGKEARYFDDTDGIIDFLIQNAVPNDLILIMSNGGFDNIHERLLRVL